MTRHAFAAFTFGTLFASIYMTAATAIGGPLMEYRILVVPFTVGAYLSLKALVRWLARSLAESEARAAAEEHELVTGSYTRVCWRCHGLGYVTASCIRYGSVEWGTMDCHQCNGTGRLPRDETARLERERNRRHDDSCRCSRCVTGQRRS